MWRLSGHSGHGFARHRARGAFIPDCPQGPEMTGAETWFHLHLISDATGETLIAASRAVTSQYKGTHAIEHVYPLIRNRKTLERVIGSIDRQPGIVLYTIADSELGRHLEESCRRMGTPCTSLLEPIFQTFQSYLGIPAARKVGAQHELNAEYFARIDALNFTMMHDDGALPEDLEEADVVLIGISRTSKTPTSIYLANRGIKTVNIPDRAGGRAAAGRVCGKAPAGRRARRHDRPHLPGAPEPGSCPRHSHPQPLLCRPCIDRRGTCAHQKAL